MVKNTKNKFFVSQKLKSFRDKKAIMRILEAFIAVLLIMSVLLVLYSRTVNKPDKAEEIYILENSILSEIASDFGFREQILVSGDLTDIEIFVRERVPSGFVFRVKICQVQEICSLDEYIGEEGREVFSNERIITATLQYYSPKKLKLFMWEE